VRLESVGKRYGVRQPWVVRGVSADLPAGLIRVSGRNGSGKSTLLRVIAGVSRPSAGRVTGRPHCGYVPERFPGGLPFSGREYLVHLARVHGLHGEAGRRHAEEWLDRLGAAGYADQPLRSLSKGMSQKIAVAQALLPSPGLLVLDEAWTGLDEAARSELDAAATERAAAGGIVLFVDHDPARLAGREDARWNFDEAGRVAFATGPALSAPAVLAADPGKPAERVVVRLETTDPGRAVAAVRAIEGVRVLSVDVEGTGPGGPTVDGPTVDGPTVDGPTVDGPAGHGPAGTDGPGTAES
jgi:ABC-type Mn2+/Zn2+ transport system ATPase subunit